MNRQGLDVKRVSELVSLATRWRRNDRNTYEDASQSAWVKVMVSVNKRGYISDAYTRTAAYTGSLNVQLHAVPVTVPRCAARIEVYAREVQEHDITSDETPEAGLIAHENRNAYAQWKREVRDEIERRFDGINERDRKLAYALYGLSGYEEMSTAEICAELGRSMLDAHRVTNKCARRLERSARLKNLLKQLKGMD